VRRANFRRISLAAIAAALLTAAISNAATIVGTSYQIDGSLDAVGFGPTTETANTSTRIDLAGGIQFQWVDGDSFDVFVQLFNASPFAFSITLSNLQFQGTSGPENILGAAFNFDQSIYGTFLQSPNNPTGAIRPNDPIVMTTTSSVTVSFGSDWSVQLAGDQPTLRFDVQTIPEPGCVALACLGFFGVALAHRRKQTPA